MLTEARLINWGRWSRGGFKKPNGASPLYRLMIEHTAPEELTVGESREPAVEIDEADALAVDRLICNSGLFPYQMEILKGKYIYNLPESTICKQCRIYKHMFQYELRKILMKILT